MGTLYYGSSPTPIPIEDRALAHIKVLVTAKLRRGEAFTLSWRHPADQPRGRSTLWLHQSIPLRFVFEEPDLPPIDRTWLDELANSVNLSGGIELKADHFDLIAIDDPLEPQSDEPPSKAATKPKAKPKSDAT